ncbi:transposable element Tcb1 transposase [Trichonephila clavipes]|nr:transposable element Tcb1 transposase [Trichonephila clavipes]
MTFFYSKDNIVALHFKYDQARRRFVEWAQNEIAVVPDFHKRILFSDEAHFWLNGYVNKQNCRIWSEANPQVEGPLPRGGGGCSCICITGERRLEDGERREVRVNTQKTGEGWEIGSHVGRNQTTVMQICDRWMQEGTTDRRGRSHPPQCATSREDMQIVRMAVTDRSVPSAQHIESVTHHSVSARTVRRRLQQSGLSARCPLLGLHLTQNHRRLRRQWCDERRM